MLHGAVAGSSPHSSHSQPSPVPPSHPAEPALTLSAINDQHTNVRPPEGSDGPVHADLLRPVPAVRHLGALADACSVHQLEHLAAGQGHLQGGPSMQGVMCVACMSCLLWLSCHKVCGWDVGRPAGVPVSTTAEARAACCTACTCPLSSAGVSAAGTWHLHAPPASVALAAAAQLTCVSTASLVVPLMSHTMERSSPQMALSRLLLPAGESMARCQTRCLCEYGSWTAGGV